MRGHTAKRQAEAHFMSDGPGSVMRKSLEALIMTAAPGPRRGVPHAKGAD
jgi:hypothetical protein